MPNHAPRNISRTPPHYTLAAGVLLVVAGLTVAVIVDDTRTLQTLLGLIVTTVPALLAAGYAERASRDIRNGTVTEKARQGTVEALEETGVTEAVEVAGRGHASLLAMEALTALLEESRARAQAQAAKEQDA